MALFLKDNSLHRPQKLFQKCSSIQLFFQVSWFLTPKYKTGTDKKLLGGTTAYNTSVERSITISYKIIPFFCSDVFLSESQTGDGVNNTVDTGLDTKVNSLISAVLMSIHGSKAPDEETEIENKIAGCFINAKQ